MQTVKGIAEALILLDRIPANGGGFTACDDTIPVHIAFADRSHAGFIFTFNDLFILNVDNRDTPVAAFKDASAVIASMLDPVKIELKEEVGAAFFDQNILARGPEGIGTENFPHPQSKSVIARQTGLSLSGLLRLFKKFTGLTPQAWALRLRIEEACIRLHHRSDSVDKIPTDLAFHDRQHVTRQFQKHLGMSPARYRKQFTPWKSPGN
jgi:AraC-like DNA-binding protein